MYALIKDNKIEKFFNHPKGFTLGDNQYPADIFSKWTVDEKQVIGIYEVVFDSSNKKDEDYYINTNQSFNYADGVVTASYGTAVGKKLTDTNEVNEDGTPMLQDGVQVVTLGLKSNKKKVIKQQASGLLQPTDWYVIKANEVEGYTVPTDISNFRAEVRSQSNAMETAIDNCANVNALITLLTYTEQLDGTITRPLPEFPKEL